MMRLKHILGPSIPDNEARIIRALLSPKYHLFIWAAGLLVALMNPLAPLAAAPFVMQVGFWLIAAALFVPFYVLYQLLILRLYQRMNKLDVPDLAVCTLAVLTISVIVLPPLPLLGIPLTVQDVVFAVSITLFLVQVGTYVFIRFAYIVIFPEIYEVETVDGLNLPRAGSEMFLRGTTLPIWRVEVIRADGQYIEVSAGTEVQRFRGRFSNVVAELPIDLGFQIHRSIWISRDLALKTRRSGRRLSVPLQSGPRLPVARDRQAEFVNWLSQQGPEYAAHALTL